MANAGLTADYALGTGVRPPSSPRRPETRAVLLGGLPLSVVFVFIFVVCAGLGVFVRRLVVTGPIGRRLPRGGGDRFGRNIAPRRQAREIADEPAQDDLPAVAHGAEIELARKGGGKELSLLERLAVVWG